MTTFSVKVETHGGEVLKHFQVRSEKEAVARAKNFARKADPDKVGVYISFKEQGMEHFINQRGDSIEIRPYGMGWEA